MFAYPGGRLVAGDGESFRNCLNVAQGEVLRASERASELATIIRFAATLMPSFDASVSSLTPPFSDKPPPPSLPPPSSSMSFEE